MPLPAHNLKAAKRRQKNSLGIRSRAASRLVELESSQPKGSEWSIASNPANPFHPAVNGFFSMFALLAFFASITIVFALKRVSMGLRCFGVSYSFING